MQFQQNRSGPLSPAPRRHRNLLAVQDVRGEVADRMKRFHEPVEVAMWSLIVAILIMGLAVAFITITS